LWFIPFLVIFCISVAFISIINFAFRNAKVSLFSEEFQLSVFNIFLLLLMLCVWAEGSFLSKGLPSINGQTGLFSSKGRLIADTAIWGFIIVCGAFFWKKLARRALLFHFAIFILMIAAISDAYLSKNDKLPIHATRQEVLSKLRFHPQDNIIVILVDTVPTAAALDLLHEQPDAFKEFDGFTLFRNNLGTGAITAWAVPATLQGALYNGGPYAAFVRKVFDSPDGLAQTFANSAIYVSSLLPQCCFIINDSARNNARVLTTNASPPVYAMQYFPFIPYLFKEHVAAYIANRTLGGKSTLTDESIYQQALIPALKNPSSPLPTVHFHHLFGVHPPYDTHDGNGNPLPVKEAFLKRNRETFQMFSDFLKELKQQNLYDDSIILLIADHGYNGIFENPKNGLTQLELPLFMVKPKNAHAEMTLSDSPFSSAYMVALLKLLKDQPERFEHYCDSLPEERHIFMRPDLLLRVQGKDPTTASVSIEKKLNVAQSSMTLKKDKVYTLDQNADADVYTLGQNKVGFDFASPVRNMGLQYSDGGWALDGHIQKDAELGFALDANGRKSVTVSFYVFRRNPLDHAEEHKTDANTNAPFPLTIIDTTTGNILYKTDNVTPTQQNNVTKIVLKNVSVNKEGEIHFHLSTSSAHSALVFSLITVSE